MYKYSKLFLLIALFLSSQSEATSVATQTEEPILTSFSKSVPESTDEINIIKSVFLRVSKNNNRSLGTLFGGIIGTVLVTTDDYFVFPIFGNTSKIFYQTIGVFLSAGTFGNLSSYIGASIDILTNERTIFDLLKYCNYKYHEIVADSELRRE